MAKKKSTRARQKTTSERAVQQPITRDTSLRRGGVFSQRLLMTCVEDIEALSDQIVHIACELKSETGEDALLRAAGIRIKQLCVVVGAYFDDEEGTTINDAHLQLYQFARRLPRGELTEA